MFMTIAANSLDLIGNTPLVLLKGPSEATGCEIWGKCEYANPGGSVKDRAALYIVRDAEANGSLRPGGTIVEGTAGNTGIGLALVGNALGYKTIIVMPDNQSAEKMATIRALGAELVLVPPAPFANPGHFVHTSRRIAEETDNAIWANQFDNIANRKSHIFGTAEEIWDQMDGRIDGFTCAAGTGGTIAGTGLGLKAKNADVFVFDPHVKKGSNVKDLNELLNKSDYLILATDHSEFRAMDLNLLKKNRILAVIDGRNCLDKEKVKSMGILYHGIGRS